MSGHVEQSSEQNSRMNTSEVNSDACIAPDFDIHRIGIIPSIVDHYFTGFSDEKSGEFEQKFMSSSVVPLARGEYTLSYIPNRTRVQKELLFLRDRVKSMDSTSCWEASYTHTEKMREVGATLFQRAAEHGLVERVTKPYIRKNFKNSLHSLNDQRDIERLMGNMGWKVIAAANGEYICVAKVGKKLSYFSVDQLAQKDPKFLKKQLKTYYMHSIYGQSLRSAAVDKAFHEREAVDVTPEFIRRIAREDETVAYHEYKNITHVLEWFDRVDYTQNSSNKSREWVLELHGLDVSRNWQVTNADNTSLFSLSQVLSHLKDCNGIQSYARRQFHQQLQWLQVFDHLEYGFGQKAQWIQDSDVALFERPGVPTREDLANTRAYIQSADDFRAAVSSWLQGRESRHTVQDLLGLLRDVAPAMAESFTAVRDMVNKKTERKPHSFYSLMGEVQRKLTPPFYVPLTVESVRTIVKTVFETAGIESLESGGSYEIQSYGQIGLAMQDLLGWVALEQVRDEHNKQAKASGKQPTELRAIDAYLSVLVQSWQTSKETQFQLLQQGEQRAIKNHKTVIHRLHIDERTLSDACDSDRSLEPYPEWKLKQLAYLIKQGKLDMNSRVVPAFLSSFFPWMTGREYTWLLDYAARHQPKSPEK